MKECIMVVDFGTSNARTNLVDITDGSIVTGHSKQVFYHSPKTDFHEIPADDYWLASVETTQRVIEDAGSRYHIAGLVFSYIGDSLVPVDAKGNPTYPMLASYDLRAKNDMELYTEQLGTREFEKISGCPLTPRNTGVKIHWLKKYMPDVAERTAQYLTLQQYVNLRLGLGPVSDYSVANRKLMLDVRTKKWSARLMDLIGSNTEEMGPVITGGDECIGRITSYGPVKFPYEIPVFPGGHDSAVGFIGLGLDSKSRGILGNVGGTFDHYGYLKSEYQDTLPAAGIQTVAGPTKDSFVTIKAHPAGKDLLWFIHQIVGKKDMRLLDGYFKAAHFGGENGSYYTTGLDTSAGSFVYLDNLAGVQKIFDTLVEGMTFLSKDIVEQFKLLHYPFEAIRVGGGSGKSDEWLQLKADVFGIRIEKVKNLEVSSTGAAIIGAVGLGICTYQEAFRSMVAEERCFKPDEALSSRYQENYRNWKRICRQLDRR